MSDTELESDASAGPSDNVRNPTGINQYPHCPRSDDTKVKQILIDYDRAGIKNRGVVSRMLRAEHQIEMSEATVGRRRKQLGLEGSKATTERLSPIFMRQLVLDQMAKDPRRRRGPRLVREAIRDETGYTLKRSFVENEMRLQDPDGFVLREPESRKILRVPLTSIGPHEEWSGDGHDKLSKIGFPVYAFRDKWSSKWLGLWVVPNNRLKDVVAYLYLSLIEEIGGMPIQTTTDCGSETTEVFGLANALREAFSPELPVDEVPAHRFMRSVHNITIERGWLRLRLEWGDSVIEFWEEGYTLGIYNPSDPDHCHLAQWLWPILIQQELDELKTRFNNHPVRHDNAKVLPSGVSPNVAYALHEDYGAENCLQPVDLDIVRELKEALGGEELVRFVSSDYAARCQAVYDSMNVGRLSFQNVWTVFSHMLPLM